MRKLGLLIGIALVVGTAAAGMSYLAAERAAIVHAELAQALQQMDTVTVLSDRFDQGLMASSAEIHIEIDGYAGEWLQGQFDLAGLENARARFGLRFNVELRHGPDVGWNWLMDGASGEPIVAVAVSALTLDQETAHDFSTALGELSPITLVSEVRMTGAHQTSVVWEPAEFANDSAPAPWTAHWRGLDGLLIRAGDGSLNGHLTGAGFDWKGVTGSLAVGGFDLEIKGRAEADGHWNGDIEQRWRDVIWTPVSELDEEAPVVEENDGHWAATDLRIDHRAGPEASGNPWQLDVRAAEGSINGAPIDSALMSLRLRQSPGSGAETSAEELEWLRLFLAPGLALDPIQLEIQGTTGSLSVVGRLQIESDDSVPIHPPAALDRFSGELQIESRGDFLTEVGFGQEMLNAWAEAGLAVVDESGAFAHFSIHNGEFGEPEVAAIEAVESEGLDPEMTTALSVLAASAEPMVDSEIDLDEPTAQASEPAAMVTESPVAEPRNAAAPTVTAPEMPALPAAIPDSPPAAPLEDISPLSAVNVEAIAPVPLANTPSLRPEKRAKAAEDALLREMIAESDGKASPNAPDVAPDASTDR